MNTNQESLLIYHTNYENNRNDLTDGHTEGQTNASTDIEHYLL